MDIKSIAKYFFRIAILLVVLVIAATSAAFTGKAFFDNTGPQADRIATVASRITSGTSNIEPVDTANEAAGLQDNDDGSVDNGLTFRYYITPEEDAVRLLSGRLGGVEEAYETAVKWIYVAEQRLNNTADKWLTPHEFLNNTPDYPDNPVAGSVVSDCEEQAHTLVSLLRANGTSPEEVRVAIGKVTFNNVDKGHAWVELLLEGQWMALDPVWGPYWDDDEEKLVMREGKPFDYYTRHDYPVIQVWAYYNDIYYLNPENGSGNAPVSWSATARAG
jgi:hypothetical protein